LRRSGSKASRADSVTSITKTSQVGGNNDDDAAVANLVQGMQEEIDRLRMRLESTEQLLQPVEQVRNELNSERRTCGLIAEEKLCLEEEGDQLKADLAESKATEERVRREADHWNVRCLQLQSECAKMSTHDATMRGSLQRAEERERAQELKGVNQTIAVAELRNEELEARAETHARQLDAEALQRSLGGAERENSDLRDRLRDARASSSAFLTELGQLRYAHRRLEESCHSQDEMLSDEVQRSAKMFSRTEGLEASLASARCALANTAEEPAKLELVPYALSRSAAADEGAISVRADPRSTSATAAFYPGIESRTCRDYPRSGHARHMRNEILTHRLGSSGSSGNSSMLSRVAVA